MRQRMGLMSRVSTVALLAAAGNFGIVEQALADCLIVPGGGTTITGTQDCVYAGFVNGDVVNEANVGPGNDTNLGPFFVGKGGISGQLWNKSTISGGDAGGEGEYYGALTIESNVNNGVLNEGQISGTTSGIVLGTVDDGALQEGDIVNKAGITGVDYGIYAYAGTMNGKLLNDSTGVISGGIAGVFIDDNFTAWTGGIENRNTLFGDAAGIQIGTPDAVEPTLEFSGGITNSGTISSLNGPTVFINGASFSGGVVNTGQIIQRGNAWESTFDGAGVVFNAGTITGGLTNYGTITGFGQAAVWVTDNVGGFTGTIFNQGVITNTGGDGVQVESFAYDGDFENSGVVSGTDDGVSFDVGILGGAGTPSTFSNTGSIGGGYAGMWIDADEGYIEFTNGDSETPSARISGDVAGVLIDEDSWWDGGGSWAGSFTNNGTIDGGIIGVGIGYDPFSGKTGYGEFTGDVVNNLVITGGNTGLAIGMDYFEGDVTNSAGATIDGINDAGAAIIVNDWVGNFSNAGVIHGADTGVYISVGTYQTATSSGSAVGAALLATPSGFTNSGTIIGDSYSGVTIYADSWTGNIANEAGAYIEGGVNGFFINAGSIAGNFTNSGSIVGLGFDTGLHISTYAYTGNIENAAGGYLSAASEALHLEIDTLDGNVTNNGTIVAFNSSGTAVVLEGYSTTGDYQGEFRNAGTIVGGDSSGAGIVLDNASLDDGITNTGTIIATRAIDTTNASDATVITNTGGGIIIGDVRLSSSWSDTFVGGTGGIYGDIVGGGEGNFDHVRVEDGTHFFIGKASNLDDFTIENDGVAVLGTTAPGVDGTGFSSSDIGAFVNHGSLYLDDNAVLNVASYEQASDVTFYLTPDTSQYGQIVSSGTVTIGAGSTLSVYLAPSFGSATATTYTYDNVIDGASISGTFDNTGIVSDSYFFDVDVIYDTANSAVDLRLLTANSFDDINCPSGVSQNNQALGQALQAMYEAGNLDPQLFNLLANLPDGCAVADFYDQLGGTTLGGTNIIAIRLDDPWKFMVDMRSNFARSGGCNAAAEGDFWCYGRYAANTTAGTGVMNDATPGGDPFAWLRTGVREVGATAVWGRVLGVWGESEGDANGPPTDFSTGGGIVGIDHVFTQTFLAGAAMQYTTTSINFSGSPDEADIDSFEIGGYFSWGDTSLYLNANASVIFHSFETRRFIAGFTGLGDYDGTTGAAYAELGKIYEWDGFRIQPVAVLSYAALQTDGYTEGGTAGGMRLIVDGTDFESLRSMLGVHLSYPVEGYPGRKIVPELRMRWAHEFLDDHASFQAALVSDPGTPFTVIGEHYARDSLVLGTGFTAPLSSDVNLYFDYDATLNADQTAHTLSAGLRAKW